MDPIITGIIVGLFIGSFGYIIGRFWLLPIWRYRRIKRQILVSIQAFLTEVRIANDEALSIHGHEERGVQLRKLSVSLSDCFQQELPAWYRILLLNRGEIPMDAAMHLMGLANIANYDPAAKRTQKIIEALNI